VFYDVRPLQTRGQAGPGEGRDVRSRRRRRIPFPT